MFEGGFGADGIEVGEPGFEQRLRHGLQRLVHAPVQFNLVVQRPQDVRYCPLFFQVISDKNRKASERPERNVLLRSSPRLFPDTLLRRFASKVIIKPFTVRFTSSFEQAYVLNSEIRFFLDKTRFANSADHRDQHVPLVHLTALVDMLEVLLGN